MKHSSAIIAVPEKMSRAARNKFQAPEVPAFLASAMPIFFIQEFAAGAALAAKAIVLLRGPSKNPDVLFALPTPVALIAKPTVPIWIALCANLVIPILLSVVRTYIAHDEPELFWREHAHHIGRHGWQGLCGCTWLCTTPCFMQTVCKVMKPETYISSWNLKHPEAYFLYPVCQLNECNARHAYDFAST